MNFEAVNIFQMKKFKFRRVTLSVSEWISILIWVFTISKFDIFANILEGNKKVLEGETNDESIGQLASQEL